MTRREHLDRDGDQHHDREDLDHLDHEDLDHLDHRDQHLVDVDLQHDLGLDRDGDLGGADQRHDEDLHEDLDEVLHGGEHDLDRLNLERDGDGELDLFTKSETDNRESRSRRSQIGTATTRATPHPGHPDPAATNTGDGWLPEHPQCPIRRKFAR